MNKRWERMIDYEAEIEVGMQENIGKGERRKKRGREVWGNHKGKEINLNNGPMSTINLNIWFSSRF